MATATVINEAVPITVTATAVSAANATATSSTSFTTSPTIVLSTTLATSTTATTSENIPEFPNRSNFASLSNFFLTHTGTAEPPSFLTATNNPFTGGHNPFTRDTSNGLSSGAKAGIGVGAAALALSIVAVALLILRMRKHEQFFRAQTAGQAQDSSAAPPSYRESQSETVHAPAILKGDRKAAPPPITIPTPPHFSEKASSSLRSPATERRQQMHKKSIKSLRIRTNSNLAPVSEEPDHHVSNLAQLTEGEVANLVPPTPITPRTPRSPRSQAFRALTGETPVVTPVLPEFAFENPTPKRSSTVSSHYSLDLDIRRPPAAGQGPS